MHFRNLLKVTRNNFKYLAKQIKSCTLCEPHLPEGPNPVFQASSDAKILIVGQAPGIRVHRSGIPFDDPSGDRLRDWMGIESGVFYDSRKVAIIPMGFCYPGKGKSGDLPPRPECAAAWRQPLLEHLPSIELTLVIGQYAIAWHLGNRKQKTLTQTVQNWKAYGPEIIPLPHPSPRNNIWMKKNPWFSENVLPELRTSISALL